MVPLHMINTIPLSITLHELSVFLEEILWRDHDVLIVFMLT